MGGKVFFERKEGKEAGGNAARAPFSLGKEISNVRSTLPHFAEKGSERPTQSGAPLAQKSQ